MCCAPVERPPTHAGVRSGRPEGQGTFEDPNGTRYVGGWKQGKQDGQGVCDTVRALLFQG